MAHGVGLTRMACRNRQEAGKKKLQAMRADCNFRRGIIFKEWEHRKMLMRTEDAKDDLNAILTAKVRLALSKFLAYLCTRNAGKELLLKKMMSSIRMPRRLERTETNQIHFKWGSV